MDKEKVLDILKNTKLKVTSAVWADDEYIVGHEDGIVDEDGNLLNIDVLFDNYDDWFLYPHLGSDKQNILDALKLGHSVYNTEWDDFAYIMLGEDDKTIVNHLGKPADLDYLMEVVREKDQWYIYVGLPYED